MWSDLSQPEDHLSLHTTLMYVNKAQLTTHHRSF